MTLVHSVRKARWLALICLTIMSLAVAVEAQQSKEDQSAAPRLHDQKLTVKAVSHSRTESKEKIETAESTETNCAVLTCTSSSVPGGTTTAVVYTFTQIVVSDGTQYTLTRQVRSTSDSMVSLNDGKDFEAEIKGKHMIVYYLKPHGNQLKKEKLTYDITDVRAAQ